VVTKCSDILAKPPKGNPPPFIVVFGDEEFLRRESTLAVRQWVLGNDPDDFTFSSYVGSDVDLATVRDELFTPPFIGDCRLIVVDGADPFVTAHRAALETLAGKPSPCGVLLLVVSTWPATTKLAKLVEQSGLAIDAAAPKAWHVADWAVRWAKQRYAKKLDKPAAEWLVELAGTTLGQLDQELSKLASFVGDREEIDSATVDQLVAGTRTENAFKLFDMILEGDLRKALELLDRQFVAGESPVGVLAMITAQLRRLTRAARETEFGRSTPEALKQAGIPPFAVDKARSQLNHFGRLRMETMYRRLLQADLDLKGSSSLSQRTVVERLLVDLARPRTA
jgi:DNA polymerase-3 subunit delta